MLPIDTYRQTNLADPVLDEQAVLNLARRHVKSCTVVSSIDETGGEARTYGIDDNMVLKVQRPHRQRSRTSLEKEVFFLNQLRTYPEIVVPRVLGYGREKSIEYIVMTRMPGVAALTVDLKGAKRTEVLLQLGRVLRRLHSISQHPFYSSSLFPGYRTQEEFTAGARANLAHAVQVIAETPDLWPLDISPEDLAEKALAGLSTAMELVALHSNPGPVHTFIQPDTLEFVGIIDFGDSYISHPALDWRWPTHQDRLIILQGYGDETPVSEEFMTAWRSLLVLSDMFTMVTRPATRPRATERLRDLCHAFE
jgi:aminoglycoside phosphotransferase (APT) family kinase protein